MMRITFTKRTYSKLLARYGRRHLAYNLTDSQKDLLRKLVQEVRAGNLPEEFWVYWVSETPVGRVGEYEGGHPPPVTQGALDALTASDLILSEPHYEPHGESSRKCTLMGNAYTAVDSDFDAMFCLPSMRWVYVLSIVTSVSPT